MAELQTIRVMPAIFRFSAIADVGQPILLCPE